MFALMWTKKHLNVVSSVALVILMLGTAVSHAEPVKRVILQAYSKQIPHSGPVYAKRVVDALASQAPLHGAALKRAIEARLSLDAGVLSSANDIRDQVKRGCDQFLEGEYSTAVRVLSQARDIMLASQALMAEDQTLRSELHRTTLFLAHAHLRLDEKARATELLGEVIRSFPDKEPSRAIYGPDLIAQYRHVRESMRRSKTGVLTVTTDPAGCMVFVNERYVGSTPKRVIDLLPGRYRIYVQRPGKPGRVRVVDISPAEHRIAIDFTLDSVLRTGPSMAPTLIYPSREQMQRLEREHAIQIGRALQAEEVVVLSLVLHQGRQTLQGTVLSATTGSVIRSGGVTADPTPPTANEIKALGRFLVLGEPAAGVIVSTEAANTKNNESVTSNTPTTVQPAGRKSIWPWITLGIGAAVLATGTILWTYDGKASCDSGGGECADLYKTKSYAIPITIVGAAALATSTALFIWQWSASESESANSSAAGKQAHQGPTFIAAPWFSPTGAGVATAMTF